MKRYPKIFNTVGINQFKYYQIHEILIELRNQFFKSQFQKTSSFSPSKLA